MTAAEMCRTEIAGDSHKSKPATLSRRR